MLTTLHLQLKNAEVCIETKSTPRSLQLKGQVTKHTIIKLALANSMRMSGVVSNCFSLCGIVSVCGDKCKRKENKNQTSGVISHCYIAYDLDYQVVYQVTLSES